MCAVPARQPTPDPLRTLTGTLGFAWMFRTQSARRPRWATSQKTSPSSPSPMGVRRGCPVDAGAIYLDSSGEPPFIRQVFEEFGPLAERTGAVLLTAFGYDYVPGNLAGALALQAAGPAAARVQVGYFVRGNLRRGTSAGTRASVAGVLLAAGYAFRGGRIVTERTAAHVPSFEIDGKKEEAFSTGSSEHFALPRLRPGQQEQTAAPRRRRSPT